MGLYADAGVAQLVEQLFRKQQVARSIRVAGSISRLSCQQTTGCEGAEWFPLSLVMSSPSDTLTLIVSFVMGRDATCIAS